MLGKLGSRMVHVVAFVALGLPIVSLLMLYGGLNPVNIFYVYMGTTTLVLFTAGFSISDLDPGAAAARRDPGDLWSGSDLAAGAALAQGHYAKFLGGVLGWVQPVNDALLLSNPAEVWYDVDPAELQLDDGHFDAGLGRRLVRVRVELRLHGDHPGVVRSALSGPGCGRPAAAAGQLVARRQTADRLVDPAACAVSRASSTRERRRRSPATSSGQP